ncbi:pangolin [Aphelenchoides avenae]|nr:pangolin [Aphelenchus avenae]
MSSVDDNDEQDELKSFRDRKVKEEEDEEAQDLDEQEKNEVAYSTEIEAGEAGAKPPPLLQPAPSFLNSPSALNIYHLFQTAAALSPQFQQPPAFMPQLSPSFNALQMGWSPQLALAATMARFCSPNSMNAGGFPHMNGMPGGVPMPPSFFSGMHGPPKMEMGTPMSSMSGHPMNGMHHYANGTPKREKPHREKRDKNHIKKPCNAFMWFMRKNRAKMLEEGGNHKQSAELNRELGLKWHQLTKEEQQEYYDLAKKEREEHMKKYPNWSARDNYAIHKKKRRKREKSMDNNDQKKCRARFGINNQHQWCKHCKRKKRCLNVRDGGSPHVSSTTHPATPSSRHNLDSPSSSALGSGMSVGRDSATSSDESDGENNTPTSSHRMEHKPTTLHQALAASQPQQMPTVSAPPMQSGLPPMPFMPQFGMLGGFGSGLPLSNGMSAFQQVTKVEK